MWSTGTCCGYNTGMLAFLIFAIAIGCCGCSSVQHIRLILRARLSLTLSCCVSLHPPGGDATAEQDPKPTRALKSRQRWASCWKFFILYRTLLSSSGHKALVIITALWESLRYPGVLSVKWSKITGFTYPMRMHGVANRGKMIGGPAGNRVNEQETDWIVYNLGIFSQ